ncbi:EcsC family protein [Desulfovibrio sp. JY]|nr:EcsC family protein [Desulfovibrio sp. JY]
MPVIDHPTILRALSWAWDRAARGLPGQESAHALAARHMDPEVPLGARLQKIIAGHKRKAALSGFVTNAGGLALLPATLPVNLAGTIFLQLRMVQAMAIVCGHDLTDTRVRALCGLCLCGAKAAEVAGAAGARLGGRLTADMLAQLGGETAGRINTLVGLRLLARLGDAGTAGVGRIVPLVSGLVGAAWDASVTAGIGKAAMALLPTVAAPDGQSFCGSRQDGS